MKGGKKKRSVLLLGKGTPHKLAEKASVPSAPMEDPLLPQEKGIPPSEKQEATDVSKIRRESREIKKVTDRHQKVRARKRGGLLLAQREKKKTSPFHRQKTPSPPGVVPLLGGEGKKKVFLKEKSLVGEKYVLKGKEKVNWGGRWS